MMKLRERNPQSRNRFTLGICTLALCGAAQVLSACGSGQSQPTTADSQDSPEAILDDEPEQAVAASSADVQKGIDAIGKEDFEGAKAILEPAVEANPDDPQAVFYLGVAESGLGETDAAIEHLNKALELDPKLSDAALNLSALLLDQEKYPEALEAANKGLAVAAGDTGLMQNKAMALLGTGADVEAAPLLAEVVKKKGDDEGLRFMYAQSLLASGDQAGAAKQLRTLTGSKDQAVLASVADLLGRLKEWDGCVEALDTAIGIEEASELYVKRGLCQHGKKDEDAAKSDFTKAIELDAKSARAQFYLGHNLRERGDKKGAKAAFKKAIELDPNGKMGQAAKDALGKL